MGTIIDNIDYKNWISNLKLKFRNSQIKASISVNRELLNFYWELGEDITNMQLKYKWGSNFLKNLSSDLKREFPEIKGFSERNLKYIRQWYLFWNKDEIGQQVVAQLKTIPWGSNIVIISKCNNIEEATFYLNNILENGWSRSVLLHHIKSNLYKREGKAITNFKETLPEIYSDLANETLKDPYKFDFLNISKKYSERELENALVKNIMKFLLELGKGFAFIGNQYHLELSGKDYYLDLLFYHIKLRCYVVIELKVGEFKPEYAGKVNFYLTLVDEKLKNETDNPSIGIILCTSKDKITAEYSLREMIKPIGVSEYEVIEKLPNEFKDILPTIEEFEEEFKKIELAEKETEYGEEE
ncbi:PDDEXK nuclease domain-containing protein [Haliovirga abyssi]|uniref:DUF1016 domain-containing protein n=1 Tax=Haliovirga abyssi TaxID=2996794 RepID=A0AAU9DYG7_9FUSO|nr:PDDEXK nuclease domain-containing protein [Haliovirga abyssi]BDU51571.1 hypothetical protein HLVA_21400 [Haliovirga abyssi]